MAHIFDAVAGGYRLVCEITGQQSGVVSTDENAVNGLEWYSPGTETDCLARQRARAKLLLVDRDGLGAEEAEDRVAGLRWDLMPSGQLVGTPSAQQIAQAEAPYSRLRQRIRLRLTVDKPMFQADGLDEAVVTVTGLIADATATLGDGLSVLVPVADPAIHITSDVPRVFMIQILDAQHWSRPLRIEAR